MATRITTAGTTSQKLTWRGAPTFHHVQGAPGEFHLSDWIDRGGLSATHPINYALAAGYTYPSGWAAQGSGGTITVQANTAIVHKDLKWVATPTGKASVTSPLGWVETVAAPVVTPTVPSITSIDVVSPTALTVNYARGVGGSDPVKYWIRRSPTGLAGSWGAPVEDTTPFAYEDTGLLAGQPYWYTVEVEDANGAKAESVAVSQTTAPGAPKAPVSYSAVGEDQDTIVLSWIASMEAPVTNVFNIYHSDTQNGTFTELEHDWVGTTYRHEPLAADSEHWYQLEACAAGLESPRTPAFSGHTKPVERPAAPIPAAPQVISDSKIHLSWTPGTGGTAPVSYSVYKSKTGAPGTFNLLTVGGVPASGITDLFYDHTSIPPNTPNWYQFTATNANGESDRSTTVTATTFATALAPPTITSVATGTNLGELKVYFTPPASGPTPAKYGVYFSTTGANGTYTKHGTEPTQSPFTHSGLGNDSEVWYKLTSIDANNVATTTYSNIVSGRTDPAPQVGIPTLTSVTAVAGSTSKLDVVYAAAPAPAATPTGFKVYWSANSGGPFSSASDAASPYQIPNLIAGTQYFVYVTALNTGFESNPSTTKTGTTNALAPDTTAPGAPTNLQATVGSTTVDLTWGVANDSTANQATQEVTGIGGYRVIQNGVARTPDLAANATSVSYDDLAPATQYTWTVKALDKATPPNVGPNSNSVTKTTYSGANIVFFENWDEGWPSGNLTDELTYTVGGNKWKVKKDGTGSDAICEIVSASPQLVGTTPYLRTTLKKNNNTAFRSEMQMDTGYFGNMTLVARNTSTGREDYAYPVDLWYGWRLLIVQLPDTITAYYLQWHDNPGGDGKSPPVSIANKDGTLKVRLEKNEDDTQTPTFSPALFPTNQLVGVAHDIMMCIRWDTRRASNGGTGRIRIWIDDDTSPKWDWQGQTCHPGPGSTKGAVPYIKTGLYKSAYSFGAGTNGATNIQKLDHLKIAKGTATYTDVKPPAPRP